jgi:23S rRNA (cytosine1962-C5)-methyltransferase
MKLLLDRITILIQALKSKPLIDSYRVLHGRGRCFEGLEFLNVDFYQPVLVFVLYKEPPDNWLGELVFFLQDKLGENLSCVLVQRRYLPNSPSEVILGVMPEKVFARRGDLRFNLHLNAQQNAGYFLDMEAGRQWIEKNASDKHVLNLFAYTCAFSVVAVAAGAKKVVNVDMSSPALNLGRSNHQLNGMPKEKTEFVAENILKSWSRVRKPGPYDVVIVDPPSYQKGSYVAERDYAKVIRRLPELMPQGGLVLACLNAPELSDDFLKKQFEEQLPQAEFVERLAAHPDFPDINPEQQLKLLVYRIPANPCTQCEQAS